QTIGYPHSLAGNLFVLFFTPFALNCCSAFQIHFTWTDPGMRLKFASLLSTSPILTACGGGDSAIDRARNMPNRFGNTVNALDDFSPGSTGDSSNARGLEPNEVRVTMEVPVSFAPSAEATRRNLRIVIPDQIQVYRTNNSLQKLEDIDYTTATGDD